MLPRITADLLDLAGCQIPRIDAAHATALMMNLQHDLGGLFATFSEELLQDTHYELHWGEIVVQQHDLIHRGWFDPRSLLLDHRSFADSMAHMSILKNSAHPGVRQYADNHKLNRRLPGTSRR